MYRQEIGQEAVLCGMNLTLFDGGESAGDAGGQAAPAAQTTQEEGRRGKTAVVYGKPAETQEHAGAQAPTAAEDSSSAQETKAPATDAADRQARFRALAEGEFGDLFAAETQRAAERGLHEAKALEARLSAQQPVLDALLARYGVADGDMQQLAGAIDRDDAYWAGAAEAAGMSVEQYRQFQTLQRENETLRRSQRAGELQQQADRQAQKWYGEAEEMKQSYPDFDLGRACADGQFLSMLRAGVPVRHAYEVMHLEDIKTGAAKAAAQQMEKSVVDGIRAKGARPQENGVSAQNGVILKNDVSKLSKQDRAEIARRVARGENISF